MAFSFSLVKILLLCVLSQIDGKRARRLINPPLRVHPTPVKSPFLGNQPFVIPIQRVGTEYQLRITLQNRAFAVRVETAEPHLWVPMKSCHPTKPILPDPCTSAAVYDPKASKFANRPDWFQNKWSPAGWVQADGEEIEADAFKDEEVTFTSITGQEFTPLTWLHAAQKVPRRTGAIGLDPASFYIRPLLQQFQSQMFTLALSRSNARLTLGGEDSALCDVGAIAWVPLSSSNGQWALNVGSVAIGLAGEQRQIRLDGGYFIVGSHSDEMVLPAATIAEMLKRKLIRKSGTSFIAQRPIDAQVQVQHQQLGVYASKLSEPLRNKGYRIRIRAQKNDEDFLNLGQPFLESNCMFGDLEKTPRLGLAPQRVF